MRQIQTRATRNLKREKVKIYENPYGRKAVVGSQEEIDKNPKYSKWMHITKENPGLKSMYGSWDIDVLPSCTQDIRERIAFLPVKHNITYL